VARKGARARIRMPRIELPEAGLPFSRLVRNISSRLSKQRLRTVKRKSKPAREGTSTRGVQGQRRAIRGNRTRQRHT
jgi:hypothetical protein